MSCDGRLKVDARRPFDSIRDDCIKQMESASGRVGSRDRDTETGTPSSNTYPTPSTQTGSFAFKRLHCSHGVLCLRASSVSIESRSLAIMHDYPTHAVRSHHVSKHCARQWPQDGVCVYIMQ